MIHRLHRLPDWFRTVRGLGAVVLSWAGATLAFAQVEITQVTVGNVSVDGFTAVWRTSAPSFAGIDVFADSAGTMSLAGTVRVEISPLGLGDFEAATTLESRAMRRDLQDAMAARQVSVVRVAGLPAGSTVFFRPRTFDGTGADNGSGLLPLVPVTTADFTSFVLTDRLLAVRLSGSDVAGTVLVLAGPPGAPPLIGVVGDGDSATQAIFHLANLVDLSTGTNVPLDAPLPVAITALGVGAPAGAFLHTVNFGGSFGVSAYEEFDAINATPAPVFVSHPVSQIVGLGETATFTVSAVGDPAPSYQWQRKAAGSDAWNNLTNDSTYTGVTAATLQVANTTEDMTGDQFRCLAANGVPPDATSSAATLTVVLGTSSVVLSDLVHTYDGTPKSATATTTPSGLAVSITYNGSATPPTNAGSYEVVATITATGYAGMTQGVLVIEKANQTITFAGPGAHTFGDAPFTVSGTASSGLPVSFNIVSGPATVFVDSVTLTGAGQVTIRATQAGNANYNAAPPVDRSFDVAKANATITLLNLAHNYTGTPRSTGALTAPLGLGVVFTYNGSATPPTDAGSYNVVATINDANYTGTAADVLVVHKAPLIARADNKSRPQGSPNPALTITYIGLLGGQTAAVLDVLPVASTAANDASPAGGYPITLLGGSDNNYEITLQNGTLTVTPVDNVPPTINVQPLSRTVEVGAPVTFSVEASGTDPLAYQWYKNAALLSGQTGASLVFGAVTFADAGSYSVRVSNAFGHTSSVIASLTVNAPPNVPTIVEQPDDQTVKRKARATFRVGAVGDAPLSYQWRKGGAPIGGATTRTLVIHDVEPGDAGLYSVVVTNPVGSATSRDARLSLVGRSWRGTYFGHFGNDGGSCAFYIRDDNTGVFCGFARGSRIPLLTRDCRVDDDGRFRFTSGPRSFLPPGIAAAEVTYDFDLVISEAGMITGTVSGLGLTVEAAVSPETGDTQGLAGFYEAGAANSSDVAFTIVGSSGEAYVLTIVGAEVDAGMGAVAPDGTMTIVTENNAMVSGAINAQSNTVSSAITPVGGTTVSFLGANNDVREEIENLVNISTRSLTASGHNVAIAGFIVQGDKPKTVLIRGIGPTLESLGVPGFLPAVHLDLYSGQTRIATADDWGAAANAADIVAAAERVAAFALPATSRDAAILMTLQPGAYTAIVVGQEGLTGITLVEVYDATVGAIPPNERVINISTRSFVGTGDQVQIAGFVVLGEVPRRVLIRGVGPGIEQFGLSEYLRDPEIELFDGAGVAFKSNNDWGDGGAGEAALIQEVAAQVSAFPLDPGSKDAALLLSLPPGAYTVHVRGVGGTTGLALVEVYDAP